MEPIVGPTRQPGIPRERDVASRLWRAPEPRPHARRDAGRVYYIPAVRLEGGTAVGDGRVNADATVCESLQLSSGDRIVRRGE
jgi:hypothetical protein